MPANQRLQDTLERLDRWLKEFQPVYHASLRPGATDAQIDELARAIGYRAAAVHHLPDDVLSFLRWHDGSNGQFYRNNLFWNGYRPMTCEEIRFHYVRCCEFAESHRTDRQRPGWWNPGWVPLFSNDSGDFLCVDTLGIWSGNRGQIVQFWHDLERRPVLADSLQNWLRLLVWDLEHGRIEIERHPFGYPEIHDAEDAVFIPDEPGERPNPTSSPLFRIGDGVRVTEGYHEGIEGTVIDYIPWMQEVIVSPTQHYGPNSVGCPPAQLTKLWDSQAPLSITDWKTSRDASRLFASLGASQSIRKMRLMFAAYCRTLSDYDEGIVANIEDYADRENAITRLREVFHDYWNESSGEGDSPFSSLLHSIGNAASGNVHVRNHSRLESLVPNLVHSGMISPDLIRDFFQDPSQPVRFEESWRTATVIGVASSIYESRAFAQLPILADALQDAECDCEPLLAHCRSSGPHTRGCWAVDLCLGLS